jgi:four helix bundle protein
MFGFQKLDVYRCAISFLGHAAARAASTPRGFGALSDQLRRASLSIPLNIAEGSGKPSQDARRFYAIARGSALECAAILDALEALGLADTEELGMDRQLLERIVAMLTMMSRGGGP